jgi:hypothetical protein
LLDPEDEHAMVKQSPLAMLNPETEGIPFFGTSGILHIIVGQKTGIFRSVAVCGRQI